jgi:hypothetical protein
MWHSIVRSCSFHTITEKCKQATVIVPPPLLTSLAENIPAIFVFVQEIIFDKLWTLVFPNI